MQCFKLLAILYEDKHQVSNRTSTKKVSKNQTGQRFLLPTVRYIHDVTKRYYNETYQCCSQEDLQQRKEHMSISDFLDKIFHL